MNLYEKEKKAVDGLIAEASENDRAIRNPWNLAALYELQDYLAMHKEDFQSIQNLDPDVETYCEAFGDMQFAVEDAVNEMKD